MNDSISTSYLLYKHTFFRIKRNDWLLKPVSVLLTTKADTNAKLEKTNSAKIPRLALSIKLKCVITNDTCNHSSKLICHVQ